MQSLLPIHACIQKGHASIDTQENLCRSFKAYAVLGVQMVSTRMSRCLYLAGPGAIFHSVDMEVLLLEC